jgi:hypothetical protein
LAIVLTLLWSIRKNRDSMGFACMTEDPHRSLFDIARGVALDWGEDGNGEGEESDDCAVVRSAN